jgi:hypothetical protein
MLALLIAPAARDLTTAEQRLWDELKHARYKRLVEKKKPRPNRGAMLYKKYSTGW